MILHTHFLLHLYPTSFFLYYLLLIIKNPDSKETKLEKSKKKTEEDTVWRRLMKKLRRPHIDYQDRGLLWLGYTTQSTNLVRDFHSVRYPVRRTTENRSWSVLSQWYICLTLNSEHLVGFRRDSYCAYSDTDVRVKIKAQNTKEY